MGRYNMEAGAYSIGVDIGTTSTKAVLFDLHGRIVGQNSVEYPLLSPVPLAAEQDPEQIYRAVIRVIRRVMETSGADGGQLACVAFSAAMHSVIAMDKAGNALTQCITWADNRSAPWALEIKQRHGGHEIYRRTGTPIHPMSPLPKLRWLKETRPELFAAADRFVSIKEYVFHRLFGRYVVDWSIASATGLFNLSKLDWDDEALAVAGVSRHQLSELVPPTYVLRGLDSALAAEMRLRPDTPFVTGANDGVLSNLGVGAITRGVVAVTIGTSGAVRTVVDRPTTDAKERTFCYALTDTHWVIGGPVNNGGMVFRWIRDELAAAETETAKRLGVDPYEVLTKVAERVTPGCDGLIFHPYMAGERAPLWNANARGSFFGLAMHHRKEHMIRAALEGVIYNLYSVLLTVEEVTGPATSIRATGGFARSELWRQMMADIFNREVDIPDSHESSCLGAAVVGLYALRHIDSLDAVTDMIGSVHHHHPVPDHVRRYAKLVPIFLSLPAKLLEEYELIAAVQRELLYGEG
jgi:gluconokinase